MKLYKIYFSPTGGTKKVADILSAQWNCEKAEIDLSDPSVNFREISIDKDDICIAAAPVYGGRIPLMASGNLSKLKGNGAKAIVVAVYGNRAYEDALLEMKDDVEEAGFFCEAGIAALAEHSIARQFAAGRPDAEDEKLLTFFAEKIKEDLEKDCSEKELYIPGNYPYKEYKVMPMIPETDETCVKCGLCAEKCPAGAISVENPLFTDAKRCISCMRCIAVCPKNARSLKAGMLEKLSEKLDKVCVGRKECELWL